ncbi:MAG: hypothetical protein JST66_04995 [Bacteroidetes bacterium]|nr:hypothetical protein [Bacteroidota bacterium]
MKIAMTALWTMCTVVVQAQVHLDRSLVLTGTNGAAHSMDGLAPAEQGSALITLGSARNGDHTWAQTGGTPMTITLNMTPPCTAYTPGLSITFMPNADAAGPILLNVDGLGPRRLLRGDRGAVDFGQIGPGRVVQVIYADTCFVLKDRPREGCPAGFLAANDRLCIQQNDTLFVSIYSASKWCLQRGARLCTWDEYIQGCTATQAQLLGLFDDWEWVDDSSDHTHTADQVGRYSCRGLRNTGAVETPNNYGGVRCCYHPR